MIGRAGVEIAGLTYDSPALDPYRQQRSPLPAFDGKWPIRVDRRELGRVWFQDPRDERFHELRWRHAREVERPFGGSALGYVKRLLVESGMRRPSEEEIATGPGAAVARALRRGSVPRSSRAPGGGPPGGDRRAAPRADPATRSRPRRRRRSSGRVVGDRDPDAGAGAVIDPGAERWRRLTVKEGWRRFVDDEPTERPERDQRWATTGGWMSAPARPTTLSGCGTRTGSGRSARSTPTSTARSSGSSSPTSCAGRGRVTARRLTATPGTGRRRSSAISAATTSGAAGSATRTS